MGNSVSLKVKLNDGEVAQAGKAVHGTVCVTNKTPITQGDVFVVVYGYEETAIPDSSSPVDGVPAIERDYFFKSDTQVVHIKEEKHQRRGSGKYGDGNSGSFGGSKHGNSGSFGGSKHGNSASAGAAAGGGSDTVLAPGKHKFPFTLKLPEHIPASTDVRYAPIPKHHHHAADDTTTDLHDVIQDEGFRIKYKMYVEFDGLQTKHEEIKIASASLSGTGESSSSSSLCLTEPKIMSVSPGGSTEEALTHEEEKQDVIVVAGLDRPSVQVGHDTCLRVASYYNILALHGDQYASIRLCEKQHWYAKKYDTEIDRVLYKKSNVRLPNASVCYIGPDADAETSEPDLVEDGCLASSSSSLKTDFPGMHPKEVRVLQALHDELLNEDNKITIKVPEDAHESYDGKLVKVEHYIEIELKAPSSSSSGRSKKHPNKDLIKRIPIYLGSATSEPEGDGSAHHAGTPPTTTASRKGFLSRISLKHQPSSTSSSQSPSSSEMFPTEPSSEFLVQQPSASSSSHHPKRKKHRAGSKASHKPIVMNESECLRKLIKSISSSMCAYEMFQTKLQDEYYLSHMRNLSIDGYQKIISVVSSTLRHDPTAGAKIAELLAPHVGAGTTNTTSTNHTTTTKHSHGFKCQYLTAALKAAACSSSPNNEYSRCDMVQRLLPYCIDLPTGHTMLRVQLTKWESVVTHRDFVRVMQQQEQQQQEEKEGGDSSNTGMDSCHNISIEL